MCCVWVLGMDGGGIYCIGIYVLDCSGICFVLAEKESGLSSPLYSGAVLDFRIVQ